jgi:hypothetical protein
MSAGGDDAWEDAYRRLPFPIAFHARRCQSRQARMPESCFLYLATALDNLVRYLALLAAADYLQQGAFEPKVNAWLQERIGRGLSLGQWLELLREVVRAFITRKRAPRVGELVGLVSARPDALELSAFYHQTNDLVGWRNSVVHPQEDPELATEIEARFEQFRNLFPALAFLGRYELMVPLALARGNPGLVVEKMMFMGDGRDFLARTCRVELPAELREEVVPEESPLLLEPGGRYALLVLYPLWLFDIEPCDELYGYLESDWRRDRAYAVTFGANQPKVQALTIRSDDAAREHILEAFRRRLGAAAPGRKVPPAAGPSFRMPSVEGEVEYHLRDFVGRQDEAARLLAWMDGRPRGYVFYEAPAGTGKSAYASFLMSSHTWPGHLVKKEGQRDRPARFLRYLLWQLMDRHGQYGEVPAEPAELAEAIITLLDRVSRRLQPTERGREVIVFDGLNELDPATPLDFFPVTLPPRVFFVVLSQPCPLLDSLEQRVLGDRVRLALEGLPEGDVQRFLDLAAAGLDEDGRQAVVARARGWPLYLKRVAETLRGGGRWRDVPAGIEGLYRAAVDRACRECGPELVAQVLGTLAVAREPLSLQALAGVVGQPGRRVRAVLDPLRGHLFVVDRRFALHHETFRAYVEQELLDAAQLRQLAEGLVQWSQCG